MGVTGQRVTEMKSRVEGAETDSSVPRSLNRRVVVVGREGRPGVNSARVAGCKVTGGHPSA